MRLEDIDKRYVWHPYTQMKYWHNSEVRVIREGKGSWLIDINGKRYIDGVASMWCNVWGHGRREIVAAIKKQASLLQHSTLFGLSNEPSILLARELVKLAKGMSRVFYSDDGSTANEVALKIAMQYWRNIGEKRDLFVSLKNGYHGDTIGAMSVGYIKDFFSNYRKMLFKVRMIDSPYLYRKPRSMNDNDFITHCIDSMERVVKKENVAAVIMESGAQLAGGAIIYPEGYQREISKICERYNTLLILDEVATGFGRLGSMIEYIKQESIPHIVTFGKMLTAGYLPLAATLVREDIYNAFLGEYEDKRHLFHGHTFTGNPLACASAISNLKLYRDERLISTLKKSADIIAKRLREIRYDIVGDIRHKGMLAAIELVKPKSKKPLKISNKPLNYFIMEEALRRKVFLRPLGHIMMIVPPLAIQKNDLEKILDIVEDIIKTLSVSI